MYCEEKKAWGPLWFLTFFDLHRYSQSSHEDCVTSSKMFIHIQESMCHCSYHTLLAHQGLAMQDPWWTTCFSRCGRRCAPPPPPPPVPPPPPASRSRSVLFHLPTASTILYSPTAIAIFTGVAFLLMHSNIVGSGEFFNGEFLLMLLTVVHSSGEAAM